jgi:L-iditol 2-dehydrogenase
VRRANISQGDTVAVFGAGAVGLLVAAMARQSGATTVLIADVDLGRVEYAIRNGFANKMLVVSKSVTSMEDIIEEKLDAARALGNEVVEAASEIEDDEFEGPDVTFDCTGKEICIQAGMFVRLQIPLILRNHTDKFRQHVLEVDW